MTKQTHEYLSLAQAVCSDIKEQVLASEDIIAPQELPYFLMQNKPVYIDKFGTSAVSLYLQHIAYLKNIRETICATIKESSYQQFVFETAKSYFSLGSTINFEIPAMLSVAHYGVGACHELALSVWMKLLKQNCPATLIKLRGRSNYGHCVVLVGDSHPSINDRIASFIQYNSNIILVDPLINYVGPANQYLESQRAYLKHFDFEYIEDVMNLSQNEITFYQIIFDKLITRLKSKSLSEFIFTSNLTHETASLNKLNHISKLQFFGHVDENLQVNAFCTINNILQFRHALSLVHQLQAGIFLKFKSNNYLVFTGINMPSENRNELSLAQKIQNA